MLDHLSILLLLVIFLVGAIGVWYAGIKLSDMTDVLAKRWGLGQALGGLLLLAIATNLPEIAITTTASLQHNLGLATGNIIGGISIQTLVLVLIDVVGVPAGKPLSYLVASLVPVLEATLVIAVLVVVVMGNRLSPNLIFARLTPGPVLIAAIWLGGLMLLNKARHGLTWHLDDTKNQKKNDHDDADQPSTTRAVVTFLIAAAVTLAAGVALEQSGDAIAKHIHMTGVLFGATVLAAATSLPEVSTGLAAAKLKDYGLVVGDIFGGNAFLPVLFVVATVLSGSAVLPQAQSSDIYLAGLGMLLTTVYIFGLILRPTRRILRMGLDSLLVLVFYLVGIGGLFFLGK